VIKNFLEFARSSVYLAKDRIPSFTRPQPVTPGPSKRNSQVKGRQPPADILDPDPMPVDNEDEAEYSDGVSKAKEKDPKSTKRVLVESPTRAESVAKRTRSTVVASGQAVEKPFNLSHLHVNEDSPIDLKEYPEPAGLVRYFSCPRYGSEILLRSVKGAR
jgi:hypothetical protein